MLPAWTAVIVSAAAVAAAAVSDVDSVGDDNVFGDEVIVSSGNIEERNYLARGHVLNMTHIGLQGQPGGPMVYIPRTRLLMTKVPTTDAPALPDDASHERQIKSALQNQITETPVSDTIHKQPPLHPSITSADIQEQRYIARGRVLNKTHIALQGQPGGSMVYIPRTGLQMTKTLTTTEQPTQSAPASTSTSKADVTHEPQMKTAPETQIPEMSVSKMTHMQSPLKATAQLKSSGPEQASRPQQTTTPSQTSTLDKPPAEQTQLRELAPSPSISQTEYNNTLSGSGKPNTEENINMSKFTETAVPGITPKQSMEPSYPVNTVVPQYNSLENKTTLQPKPASSSKVLLSAKPAEMTTEQPSTPPGTTSIPQSPSTPSGHNNLRPKSETTQSEPKALDSSVAELHEIKKLAQFIANQNRNILLAIQSLSNGTRHPTESTNPQAQFEQIREPDRIPQQDVREPNRIPEHVMEPDRVPEQKEGEPDKMLEQKKVKETYRIPEQNISKPFMIPEQKIGEPDKIPEKVGEPDRIPEHNVSEANRIPEQNISKTFMIPEQKIGEPDKIPEQVGEPDRIPEQNVSEANRIPEQNVSEPYRIPEQNVSEPYRIPEQKVGEPDRIPEQNISGPNRILEQVREPDRISEQKAREPDNIPEQNVSEPNRIPEQKVREPYVKVPQRISEQVREPERIPELYREPDRIQGVNFNKPSYTYFQKPNKQLPRTGPTRIESNPIWSRPSSWLIKPFTKFW